MLPRLEAALSRFVHGGSLVICIMPLAHVCRYALSYYASCKYAFPLPLYA